MATKKLKVEKLVNGGKIYPPEKGESVGPWAEVKREPTEIVSFGEFRGSAVFVWFYDRVHRIRMHANGTKEIDVVIEHIPGKLDVRDETVPFEIIALIDVGAKTARALRNAFERREAEKKAKVEARQKPRRKTKR